MVGTYRRSVFLFLSVAHTYRYVQCVVRGRRRCRCGITGAGARYSGQKSEIVKWWQSKMNDDDEEEEEEEGPFCAAPVSDASYAERRFNTGLSRLPAAVGD